MLIVTALVLGLIVVLLAMPITLELDVSFDRTLRQEIRLLWAFGLLDVKLGPGAKGAKASESANGSESDFSGSESRYDSDPEKSRAGRKRLRAERKGPKRKLNVLGALRLQRFRQRLYRLVGALWRAVQTRDLRLRVRLGLGDPAATGQLWALLGPLAGVLATFRKATISIEPEFAEPALELETRGSIRVVPLRLLGIVAALAVSPAIWQGVRVMRAGS